jgi:hypothetical protein
MPEWFKAVSEWVERRPGDKDQPMTGWGASIPWDSNRRDHAAPSCA